MYKMYKNKNIIGPLKKTKIIAIFCIILDFNTIFTIPYMQQTCNTIVVTTIEYDENFSIFHFAAWTSALARKRTHTPPPIPNNIQG